MNSSAVHVALCRMSALGVAPEEESRALRATFSFRDHHRLTGSPSPQASLSVHQSCATTESTSSFVQQQQQQQAPQPPSSSSSPSAVTPASLSPAANVTGVPTPAAILSTTKTTPPTPETGSLEQAPQTAPTSAPAVTTVRTSTMPLPSCTELLDSQIAGHRHGEGKHKLGMLRHKDGSILKPLVPNDSRAGREHEFYLMLERHREMCSGKSCDDPVLHQLVDLTPRYLGVFEGELDQGRRISYMKLEDLCKGFKQPCIADIKIGRIIHDPLASKEKIEVSKKRYPPQLTIGYRLLGMRVVEDGRYHVYSSEFGLEQTEKSIPEAIKTFVAANVDCVPAIVEELRKILQWFKSQQRFTFYSSSILFVYDATELKTSVKLIDFAHVFPATGADENYIYGLERLLNHFCQAMDDKL